MSNMKEGNLSKKHTLLSDTLIKSVQWKQRYKETSTLSDKYNDTKSAYNKITRLEPML